MAVNINPRTPPQTRPQTERNTRRQRRRVPQLPHPHRSRRGERRAATAAALVVAPQAAAVPAAAPNFALAGLELLVGYEWLVSGVDKLLFGGFPAALHGLLAQTLSGGQLPGFFAALLRALVLPNAVPFGYLIEWGETLAGIGLIAAGLVALLRPLARRYLAGRWKAAFGFVVRLLDWLAPVAAAGAGLLGLSFFFLDGLPSPWLTPSIAYGGAVDTGLFLAAASVVLLVSRLAAKRR